MAGRPKKTVEVKETEKVETVKSALVETREIDETVLEPKVDEIVEKNQEANVSAVLGRLKAEVKEASVLLKTWYDASNNVPLRQRIQKARSALQELLNEVE